MPTYDVHVIREMRLMFSNITADSPARAAEAAADLRTNEADDVQCCEGRNIEAIVDLLDDVGELVEDSTYYFDAGRKLNVADEAVGLLRDFVAFGYSRTGFVFWEELEALVERSRLVLRKAKGRE